MPSTPTTKSQVQAYRFVLRRMESALVRKDPVMLHDPMRSHKRSTVVGIIVGVVGLVGFLLFGVLKPAPTVPTSGIVISQPSGQVYVVSQSPHELIPVFNLASARLLLAAGSQQQSQQSGAQANTQQAAPQVVQPTTVDDDQLNGMNMSMGKLTGIPDGPTSLPDPNGTPTDWAVCDAIPRDVNSTQQTTHGAPTTTVLVGVSNIGANLAGDNALLVSADDGKTLNLVYGLTGDVNHPDDSAVRAQIDTGDEAVMTALGIKGANYRTVSTAVLNAIPAVQEIKNPAAGLDNTQGSVPALADAGVDTVGQGFEEDVAGSPPNFFISVPGGAQPVSATTAQIARNENSAGKQDIVHVTPQVMNSVKVITNGLQVDVSDYPGALPTVVDAATQPVMCLGWHADFTDPQKPLAKTRVTIQTQLSMPVDPTTNTPMGAVQIGTGTAQGKINSFFMSPALGGVAIRAASNAKEFTSGPIYVIDRRGIAFSVPDLSTAQVLGVADSTGKVAPAPQSIVGLLPAGGQPLSIQAVQRTFDSMNVPDSEGQFMSAAPQAGGN
jgi:type VII secretion protein EccB